MASSRVQPNIASAPWLNSTMRCASSIVMIASAEIEMMPENRASDSFRASCARDLRNVHDEHEETLYFAVDDVGDVVGEAVARPPSGRIGNLALELLKLAAQHRFDCAGG